MKLSGFKSVAPGATKFYCALCGQPVPIEAKWFTRLFQTEIKDSDSYRLFIGYICPHCGAETETNYSPASDATGFIDSMSIYSTTKYNKQGGK